MMIVLVGCQGTSATYRIELDSNTTTGYTWEYEMLPEGIIKETKNEYIAPEDTGMVGVGGKQVFEFVGLKEGEVSLLFVYRRPWEPTKELDEEGIEYILKVDKDLNIKLKSKNTLEIKR